MTRSNLPTLNELVTITSGITETLFGMELRHDRHAPPMPADSTWHAEALTLSGEKPLHIIVAAQGRSLKALVDTFSIEDANDAEALLTSVLGEVVNLVAGQIKAVLAREYTMGLPYTVPVTLDVVGEHVLSAWMVNRDASVKLWTAVIEGD